MENNIEITKLYKIGEWKDNKGERRRENNGKGEQNQYQVRYQTSQEKKSILNQVHASYTPYT